MRHLIRPALASLLVLLLSMPGCVTMATHYELGKTPRMKGMALALTPITLSLDLATFPLQLPLLGFLLDPPAFHAIH